ncbi:MAG: histidinol-phosphate transaminase [Spirochaetaceae bacterium]|jgi:histidinol-phosphate aminotransferase|nr:histidinol-phosphate transaminase [Spirochaetaceae bacterium]
MPVSYRKALDNLLPYKAARSLESVKREFGVQDVIKLAANENCHGFSPRVTEAVLAMQNEITFYPDTEVALLRDALVRKLGVAENELVFGNGSFELLTFAATAFLDAGTEAIMPKPSFGWYYIMTTVANAVPVIVPLKNHAVDLDAILGRITAKTRLIWLCNPNNPTGTYITGATLDAFIQEVPENVLILLDEAYIDFAPEDTPRAIELIHRHNNIITLRTFSKVYGLASLRIGYAAGNAGLIEKLSRVRAPVNVNALAQTAALAALEDNDFYNDVVRKNREGRQLYYTALERLGLEYIPTACNFIMFNTKRDSGAIEYEYTKRGVLVRSGAEFDMPSWIRVTIGTEAQNRKVLEILEEIVNN